MVIQSAIEFNSITDQISIVYANYCLGYYNYNFAPKLKVELSFELKSYFYRIHYFPESNMRAAVIFCLVIMAICLMTPSEANYRKPPFNGSIFGKRGNIGIYTFTYIYFCIVFTYIINPKMCIMVCPLLKNNNSHRNN